jgi:predicted metal-dependent enzyme (double-stranded beta helix superfamily)
MFELDQFVSDCRAALRDDMPQRAVQEVVRRAVSTPGDVLKAIGEPKPAEMQTLYRSDDLTILNVIWAPWMNLLPHNHQMWAIIGLYTGREDNIFWRRVPGSTGMVEAAGARALREKDAEPLGRDIIHSVSNPIPKLTGALHVMAEISLAFHAVSGTRKRCWSSNAAAKRWPGALKKRMRC